MKITGETLMKLHLTFGGALIAALLSSSAMAAELRVVSGTSIQAVIDQAQAGDTILVEPGEYKQSIYIDKPGITLQGLRDGDNWPMLNGEKKLNDGIIASGHSVVISGFHVKGYKGNGIMTQGANNFKILDNFVEGAFYGIFPQFGKNGVVQGNTVTGCEDAGIYVGMSDNIDVVGNTTHGNVIGIEFENTRNALMTGNNVYDNSAGIALTLLPGLPVKDSFGLVVRGNKVIANNHENFAPSSSIAAGVPTGIGILVLAPDEVTIEDNEISDNFSTGVLVSDLITFGLATDPKIDPYSDKIRILANKWSGNGEKPAGAIAEMLAPTGKTGIEVLVANKGRDNCLAQADGVDSLGTKRWEACTAEMSKATMVTAMIAGGAEEPVYTAEQKGRLTYLAVCSGCHAYDSVLHGPSIQSIKALYSDDPAAMLAFVKKPVHKREGFPEMPPQDYLGEETLKAITNYVLNELGN